MNIPPQTGEIFEILYTGQFICSNSTNNHVVKLYDLIDDKDKYEILYDYFSAIGFVLEKGNEFYYFSRKNESKADLERKLEAACRWIDILDFFKTFNNSFGSGYNFTIDEIAVKIRVDAILKSKVDNLRTVLKLDAQMPHSDVVSKVVEQLYKEGFVEMENEISQTYKILSSFKYLEELVMNINIPDEIQNEIIE
jgi:hypothetical protein